MKMLMGATQCGKAHSKNQDRILTRLVSESPRCGVIAVADGISRCAQGGEVAAWLLETRMAVDPICDPGSDAFARQTRIYLEGLGDAFQQAFRDDSGMFGSGACLSVVVFRWACAHCFWVGDCPVYATEFSPGAGKTYLVSKPDVDPYRGWVTDWFGGTSPYRLKYRALRRTTSMVTVVSDGVALEASELHELYTERGFDRELPREVVSLSTEAAGSDDASFVAVKLS